MKSLRGLTSGSVIALAISVTACGSGGGGGNIAFIPPPMPTPTPTPTPSATDLAIISAPAAASATSPLPPVFATAGGVNFKAAISSAQSFPLLQTTLVLDAASVKADANVNAAGGTAAVISGEVLLNIGGFSRMQTSSGDLSLDWTRVGYWSTGGVWDYWEDLVRHRGVFVAGYETPAAGMPVTGSATYTGIAKGALFFQASPGTGAGPCKCGEVPLSGTATFTANFGTRLLAGSLSLTAPPTWVDENADTKWNDVVFNATISGNRFSGDTRVTDSPKTTWSMAPTATGTIEGKFFGPTAQEAGAVWTLFDGTKSAIGTLSGKGP